MLQAHSVGAGLPVSSPAASLAQQMSAPAPQALGPAAASLLLQQQQQQNALSNNPGLGHLLAAQLAAANPQAVQQAHPGAGNLQSATAFEGVPIFLVPQGTSPALALPMLHKAQEMKLNWANSANNNSANNQAPKIDTSKHFHVFVGDLSPEVDNKMLREAFQVYGELSDCKVIRDGQTLKSKGYGFVSFVKKEEAEKAIEAMNGAWVGRRNIRTNWATRKPAGVAKTYDEIYNSTTPGNTTVYVGGTLPTATEEELRAAFQKFGAIAEVRLFKSQGYAFVRFESKESAAQAIVALNGQDVAGATVRCSWGRQQDATTLGTGLNSAAGLYAAAFAPFAAAAAAPFSPTPAAPAAQAYWPQYYAAPGAQAAANPSLLHQWHNFYQQQGQ